VYTQTATGQTISGVGIGCSPGQCTTNIYNGSKTCPQLSTTSLIANPSIEVCNDKFICNNLRTPYSLQSDGSSNINGICESGIVCRCINKLYCSNNVLTIFKTTNGNVYTDLQGQRLTITQNTGLNNSVSLTGPNANINKLTITDPLTEFCTISNSWLPNLAPGVCNTLDTSNLTQLSKCMNLNPCVAGTLAFIPENIEEFKPTDSDITPMSCVYGIPCPVGFLAAWDNVNYRIRCVQI
jgi:hypothetical protein